MRVITLLGEWLELAVLMLGKAVAACQPTTQDWATSPVNEHCWSTVALLKKERFNGLQPTFYGVGGSGHDGKPGTLHNIKRRLFIAGGALPACRVTDHGDHSSSVPVGHERWPY